MRLAIPTLIVFLLASPLFAQLRIVTYNTATAQPGSSGIKTARAGVDTVLQAIGAESTNGIAKPVDVLLLQEQFSNAVSTQSFVDVLNGIYGSGVYARGTVDGFTSSFDGGGGAPALVYNTQSVSLISEVRIGVVGGNPNQPRSTMRYRLRPVGYDSSADFYAYNSHYKASTGSTNEARRLLEAQRNRDNADALGQGASIIYAGDFNIRSSNEGMYQELLSSGAGQAFDPINLPGTWHNGSSEAFERSHTQSPLSGSSGPLGLVAGGMDDRFDFQLLTGELLDDEGLSYISGSYHVFGNNGSHECCGDSITDGNGASPAVLTALTTASDHLPVVADYQLPAVLEVMTASVPSTLEQDESFSLSVMVRNAVDVLAAIGGDELDYSLTTSGDLSGSFGGTRNALEAAAKHLVGFDTSSAGMKSGMLTVTTSSQSAADALFELPINYEVLASPLEGDFNDDGRVDAADYAVWRNGLGGGGFTQQDYLDWRGNYGAVAESGVAEAQQSAAVPEPAVLPGMLLSCLLLALSGTRRLKRAEGVHAANHAQL